MLESLLYELLIAGAATLVGDPLWEIGGPQPRAAEIVPLAGVQFHGIKQREPEKDGYNWLHGLAIVWHKEQLWASFGHNRGDENTAGEEARYCKSRDHGATWSEVSTIDPGEGNLAVSHGVFLSHHGELWAFHGAFYDDFSRTHTRAYVLSDSSEYWQNKGIIVDDGFWPMQEPQLMQDGNFIMAGIRVGRGYDALDNLPAVAISHGTDLSQWDLVVIPRHESVDARIWGESTVIVEGNRIMNISRWHTPIALVAESIDYGRTWTSAKPSNLRMTASKPYAGILSTGQRYLIGTITADSVNRRWPLTIAVSRPGEELFSKVYRIRDAEHQGPGESGESCALSYPYTVEYDGRLYVAYSNDGGRGGNRNSAEIAIIPLESLSTEE